MRMPAFTIKSYMIVFLAVLGLAYVFTSQRFDFLFQMIFATAATVAIDVAINLVKIKKLALSSSAVISGLFIGTILPLSPFYIIVAAALVSMLSKHVIKFSKRHIFNPAAFGIVVSGIIFSFVPIWWSSATLLSIPLGLFIVYKMRKWLLVLSFIITYYALLMLQNLSDTSVISFINPTLFFFMLFMLTEPLTSAYARPAMVAQGIMVGILVILVSTYVSGAEIFLLPLLISNIFVGALNKNLKPFNFPRTQTSKNKKGSSGLQLNHAHLTSVLHRT